MWWRSVHSAIALAHTRAQVRLPNELRQQLITAFESDPNLDLTPSLEEGFANDLRALANGAARMMDDAIVDVRRRMEQRDREAQQIAKLIARLRELDQPDRRFDARIKTAMA